MSNPISAGLWVFASSAEKFSYDAELSVREQIKAAAQVEGLEGLELIAPTHVTVDNVKEIKALLEEVRLRPVSVNPNLWTDDKWQYGALTAPDEKIRREAIETAKRAIDIGHELGTRRMCLWPGQDGFDYPFQANYDLLWEWTLEAIREIAEYDPKTQIGYEYKSKEPRTHMLVGNAAKAALIGELLGLKNVGAYLDFGHALMGRENPAESVALLARCQRLMGVHINDCYGLWDDDITVAAVHLPQVFEFLLTLRQVGYEDWISLDLVPVREDIVEACRLSVRYIQSMQARLDKLYADEGKTKALQAAQSSLQALESQEIIRELIFG